MTARDVRTRHVDATALLLTKLVVAAIVLVVVLRVAGILASLIGQTIIAAFIAIAIDTAARSLQRRGMSRGRSVTVVFLLIVAAAVFAAAIIIGPLLDGAASLADTVPDIVASAKSSDTWQRLSEDLHLRSSILGSIGEQLKDLPSALADLVVSAVGSIFGLVNVALMVIFLVTGGHRALDLAVRMWPRLATGTPWGVVTGAYDNIGRYLLGATGQALLAAVSLAMVLWISGTPYVLPLALLMFLLDYVPLVGATLASIPAVAVALFSQGWLAGIAVTAFLIIYQQLENAYIQPKIQGKVVELPLIAIFFSVLIGAELFGVAGALLAVPTASVVAIFIRSWFAWSQRDQVVPPRLFDDSGFAVGRNPPRAVEHEAS